MNDLIVNLEMDVAIPHGLIKHYLITNGMEYEDFITDSSAICLFITHHFEVLQTDLFINRIKEDIKE